MKPTTLFPILKTSMFPTRICVFFLWELAGFFQPNSKSQVEFVYPFQFTKNHQPNGFVHSISCAFFPLRQIPSTKLTGIPPMQKENSCFKPFLWSDILVSSRVICNVHFVHPLKTQIFTRWLCQPVSNQPSGITGSRSESFHVKKLTFGLDTVARIFFTYFHLPPPQKKETYRIV